MAQTILTGFDDVWVSSANYNTQKYSANASEYRVFQFVIKRSVDGKLFFGYKVESLKANTVSVGVFDNGGGVYGSIQAKDKYGVIVGSSTGHDRTLSKWNNVDGNYAIMVYAVDDYPGVATVRYFGKHNAWGNDPDSNNLYVNIYYGSGVNLGGSFEITTTSISSYLNQIPTLSLSSPPNNLTLTEGSTYQISGSATDADSGNVVTVKFKIDDGTTYNVTASVSDGTTPLNFSKTLTYLNSRLYDGATPVTPILDDSVTHKLTVWAEDDKGGKSVDAVRNFTVLYNQPPQISGSDQDLGSISAPPSINYTVTDIEHYSFTITEKVGDTIIRSFAGTDGKQETLTIPDDIWITLQPDVTHNLTITATDQYGASSTRTYTFKRTVDGIELETRIPLPADAQPYRMVLTLNAQYPQNAVVNVQVCNNGYDENPTWEDATSAVLNGRPYVFTNTTKTALDWGIRIKISILPGA
mgnify:CR=1 FL=1